MIDPKVWLRFEKKKKDGTVMKLRIQDLPPDRVEEAVDIMVKYFARDEPYHKAFGFSKNPEALEEYRGYVNRTFCNPASSTVICVADTFDKTPDIMGISCVAVETKWGWDPDNATGHPKTEETKKLYEMSVAEIDKVGFDLIKQFNLTSYYAGKSLLVVPKYRGYGISQQFLTVRRMMCAAHNIPMTGAWMTAYSTQISAMRDGWKTYCETNFKDTAQKYGLTFEDVPPTEKFMAAWPHPDFHVTK